MSFIDSIVFPDDGEEFDYLSSPQLANYYDTYYPFGILSKRNLRRLDFEKVTILCGGNGCGKTTALNVIAEKQHLKRHAAFNRSSFFDAYADMCRVTEGDEYPTDGMIITSDDIFDMMLDIRDINDAVDRERSSLSEEYLHLKYEHFQMKSLEDYEKLKRHNKAKRDTVSKFVRDTGSKNIREHSNGETAFRYFVDALKPDGLYLLDEPENSLSSARQKELAGYIEDMARYENCQFIISTHSPFILAIKGAKIYDMDEEYPDVKKWTELALIRDYYELFAEYKEQF